MIKTIILCGGQGTRIRDVADDIPKPMIPIGERPIVWHIMQTYAASGLSDFVLCLGYKGWLIKQFFLDYRMFSEDIELKLGSGQVHYHEAPALNWCITFAETGEHTQTGGRIARVRKYVEDCELICVTYGDGVADLNVMDVVRFHREHGKIATVTGVRPPGRFGVMQTERKSGRNIVRHFAEKPQTEEGWINGGYFVFDQRIWKYLKDEPSLILEREPLSGLAADGELVMYEHAGFWQPMDTYREYRLLNDMWTRDEAPWKR